jgi:sn-glycerol 3-phosphate transport system substrate-binding protein
MTPRLRRLVALTAGGALLVASAAAACSSPTRPRSNPPSSTTTAPADAPSCTVTMPSGTNLPVTIRVSEAFDTRSQQAANLLVSAFNASQNKVQVVLDSRSTSQSVEQQLGGRTVNDQTPALVVLDDIRTQAVADSGKIIPADRCIDAAHGNTSAYLPPARAYYTVDDHLQALSANLTAPLLYFDRKAFRDAGLDPTKPPTTLQAIYQDALALHTHNPTLTPLAMSASSFWVESWLNGASTTLVNNNNGRAGLATGSTFDNARSLAIYRWLQQMFTAQLIDLVPDRPDQHSQLLDLATGRSPMLIDSSAHIADFDALESATFDPSLWGLPRTTVLPPAGRALDLDVAPLPGLQVAGRGQISGSGWYLNAATTPAQQAAAWAFISWWNQPAQQAQWSLDSAYLPYTNAAVSDSELQFVWQHTRQGRWLDTAYTELTDIDQQSPGPLVGPYAAVRSSVVQAMTMVTSADMDPQVAITESDATIDGDLTEYQLARPSPTTTTS